MAGATNSSGSGSRSSSASAGTTSHSMERRRQLQNLALAWTRRWHSAAKPRPLTSPEVIAGYVVVWLQQGIDLKVVLEVLETANAYTKKALEYRMGQALGYVRPDLPEFVPQEWAKPTVYGRERLSEMRELLRQPGAGRPQRSDGLRPVGGEAPTIGSLRRLDGRRALPDHQRPHHQNGEGDPLLDGPVEGPEVELQGDVDHDVEDHPDDVQDGPGDGEGGERGQGHLF